MKIVHVASELYPFMKTGGLADAVGALAAAMADRGHTVSVFLPGYREAFNCPEAAGAARTLRLKVEMGGQFLTGDIWACSPRKNLTVHFVGREEFFDRRHPYGTDEREYEDNADRFTFFCKAVVETLRLTDMGADIVHGHDWQAGLLPLLLREAERRHGATLAIRTVFTVHNIAFQGLFPAGCFARTNLPDDLYGMDGLEYYGQVNFLKGGILFADKVTTVSPSYAQEIQTPEFGCGLEGVVQTRAEDLSGFINGVDDAVWNPAVDPLIPARYSAADLAGKRACRAELLRRCGWDPAFGGPIFAMICRMTEQKGVDLVLANRDFFLGCESRLVMLGTGDKRLEGAVREWAAKAPDRLFVSMRRDESMSHLIEAGADFFLMPSLFEPCGLNQMYSQAYGTVPIVSRVGGLRDTVTDIGDNPAASGTGLTCAAGAAGLRRALDRAIELFAAKSRMAAVQRRGMERDFSWRTAATAYEDLYRDSL